MLTELIVGRTIAECRELTTDDLIAALDGEPPDKRHFRPLPPHAGAGVSVQGRVGVDADREAVYPDR
jgi:NifU-like protein involved in Fe-S cluster formation